MFQCFYKGLRMINKKGITIYYYILLEIISTYDLESKCGRAQRVTDHQGLRSSNGLNYRVGITWQTAA